MSTYITRTTQSVTLSLDGPVAGRATRKCRSLSAGNTHSAPSRLHISTFQTLTHRPRQDLHVFQDIINPDAFVAKTRYVILIYSSLNNDLNVMPSMLCQFFSAVLSRSLCSVLRHLSIEILVFNQSNHMLYMWTFLFFFFVSAAIKEEH